MVPLNSMRLLQRDFPRRSLPMVCLLTMISMLLIFLIMKRDVQVFLAHEGDTTIGQITLSIPGEHNVQNALAAIALCTQMKIPVTSIISGLSAFHGTKRRFEKKVRSAALRSTITPIIRRNPRNLRGCKELSA